MATVAVHAARVLVEDRGQWQERPFGREGEAMGTVADALLDSPAPMVRPLWPRWRYGVYWRGELYVHCRGGFVMRLSLSSDKYRVIKTPTDIEESNHAQSYLGRSEKGVYFASIRDWYQLTVWILDDSCGQIK